MGRTRLAVKNIFFGYVGQAVTAILGFVLKQVFITQLGDTLNGVNGLYTGILSMLNIAELGIGTAMNFALYKPVAENDREKIKSYMKVYAKAYHIIGLVIAIVGLVLVPFLPVFIRNPGDNSWRDLTLYYLIFLFNTCSGYFVSYKYSLVNAEQKNYIQTNILSATKFITTVLQIIILQATKSFYAYLLTDLFVQLAQKFFVNWYLNRRYPYLREKNVKPLDKEESGMIFTKVKALIWMKIGDVARTQTDSLIISSFIAVTVSGLVDNYNQVVNSVANFANIIFNSMISGLGNLVATESKKKQKQIFGVYRFAAAWIYGYVSVAFFILLTPFVGYLWLTPDHIISAAAIDLILLDFLFKGERIVLMNFKTAAGVFEPDKFLPAIQGLVNLVLSIWLVIEIGLPGVYIGTVVSGLMANIVKPFIIAQTCFDEKPTGYFVKNSEYYGITFALAAVLWFLSQRILGTVSWGRWILMALIVTVLFNGVFFLVFRRTEEFRYLENTMGNKLKRKIRNRR